MFPNKYISQSSLVFPNFFNITEDMERDHFVWHSWVKGGGYFMAKDHWSKDWTANVLSCCLERQKREGLEAKLTEPHLESTVGRCQAQLY